MVLLIYYYILYIITMPSLGDTMLLLRGSPRHTATKTHHANGTDSYKAGYLFSGYQRSVSSIQDIAMLIDKACQDKRTLIVRGKLTDRRSVTHGIRRQYLQDNADIKACDHYWLAIDLDSAPAPDWLDPTSRESLRRAVRWAVLTYMPPEFHGAKCYYRWSASAGVKPWSELRLQFWYWLDKPVCDFSLRVWAKQIQYIDSALYNPVQPHFIATPVFIGIDDPLGDNRSGVIGGRESVRLPDSVVDLETWNREQSEAEIERRRELDSRVDYRAPDTVVGRFVDGAVRKAVAAIRSAPVGSRHHTIFAQAVWLGKFVGAGVLDESSVIAALEPQAHGIVPEKRHKIESRAIRDGIATGILTPIDLRIVRGGG